MKKIMIYSGQGNIRSDSLRQKIKQNADVILLYTAVICGLFTGSIILRSLYAENIITNDSCVIFANSGQYLIRAGVYSSVFILLAYFGALSCFGILLQVMNGFFYGAISGALFSFFLLNNSTGASNRTIICLLPGTIVLTCAFLLYSADCIKISGSLCMNFFFQKNEKSDLRIFTIKTLMMIACTGICLLLNMLLLTIFA